MKPNSVMCFHVYVNHLSFSFFIRNFSKLVLSFGASSPSAIIIKDINLYDPDILAVTKWCTRSDSSSEDHSAVFLWNITKFHTMRYMMNMISNNGKILFSGPFKVVSSKH